MNCSVQDMKRKTKHTERGCRPCCASFGGGIPLIREGDKCIHFRNVYRCIQIQFVYKWLKSRLNFVYKFCIQNQKCMQPIFFHLSYLANKLKTRGKNPELCESSEGLFFVVYTIDVLYTTALQLYIYARVRGTEVSILV